MKRRSFFFTTAFAALGIGRVAAQASVSFPTTGVDPAFGEDKISLSVCKVEDGKVSRIRTITPKSSVTQKWLAQVYSQIQSTP